MIITFKRFYNNSFKYQEHINLPNISISVVASRSQVHVTRACNCIDAMLVLSRGQCGDVLVCTWC